MPSSNRTLQAVITENTTVSVSVLVIILGAAVWALATAGKADAAVAGVAESRTAEADLKRRVEDCSIRMQRVETAQEYYVKQQEEVKAALLRLEGKLDTLREKPHAARSEP